MEKGFSKYGCAVGRTWGAIGYPQPWFSRNLPLPSNSKETSLTSPFVCRRHKRGVLSCPRPEEVCSVGRTEKERQASPGGGVIREAGQSARVRRRARTEALGLCIKNCDVPGWMVAECCS